MREATYSSYGLAAIVSTPVKPWSDELGAGLLLRNISEGRSRRLS